MLLGVVGVADVVVVDLAATVSVKLLVGTLDKFHSLGVHGALDHAQKFVVVDGSISILVKSLEESLDVDVGEVEARLSTALCELLKVESAGAVVIHDLEDTADTNDGSGSSLEHLATEGFNQVRCAVDENKHSVRI